MSTSTREIGPDFAKSDEFEDWLVVRDAVSGTEVGEISEFEGEGEGDSRSNVELESDTGDEGGEEKSRRNDG